MTIATANQLDVDSLVLAERKFDRQSDKEQQRGEKCVPVELGAMWEWYTESQ